MNIYKINDIAELIEGNSYVGRGIVIGKTADAKRPAPLILLWGEAQIQGTVFLSKGTEIFLPNLLIPQRWRIRV